MKSVVLLHTIKNVLNSFEPLLNEVLGYEIKVHNILDEFLVTDATARGEFSTTNRQRLMNDLVNAQLTGADLIVVTCSSLTPFVVQARPFFSTRIIAIDDAMTAKAVRLGSRIAVLATAPTTVAPTMCKLEADAATAGVAVELTPQLCPEAIAALKRGDRETHDRLVLDMVRQAKSSDVIVLAQASMAHLQEEAEKLAGVPVLASPRLCCESVKELLAVQ
ncbi:MAG: aspartate/glutamate racemase family protein [Sphaerochaetaceae bacterium]|nr:aspartate/glutamate racemase family protein [Sphaerochaetaceae bacterium]